MIVCSLVDHITEMGEALFLPSELAVNLEIPFEAVVFMLQDNSSVLYKAYHKGIMQAKLKYSSGLLTGTISADTAKLLADKFQMIEEHLVIDLV